MSITWRLTILKAWLVFDMLFTWCFYVFEGLRFDTWHPHWHLWMVVAYLLSIFNAQGVWVEKAHLHLSMVVAFCSIEGWHLRWMIWHVCLVVMLIVFIIECWQNWAITSMSNCCYCFFEVKRWELRRICLTWLLDTTCQVLDGWGLMLDCLLPLARSHMQEG